MELTTSIRAKALRLAISRHMCVNLAQTKACHVRTLITQLTALVGPARSVSCRTTVSLFPILCKILFAEKKKRKSLTGDDFTQQDWCNTPAWWGARGDSSKIPGETNGLSFRNDPCAKPLALAQILRSETSRSVLMCRVVTPSLCSPL